MIDFITPFPVASPPQDLGPSATRAASFIRAELQSVKRRTRPSSQSLLASSQPTSSPRDQTASSLPSTSARRQGLRAWVCFRLHCGKRCRLQISCYDPTLHRIIPVRRYLMTAGTAQGQSGAHKRLRLYKPALPDSHDQAACTTSARRTRRHPFVARHAAPERIHLLQRALSSASPPTQQL